MKAAAIAGTVIALIIPSAAYGTAVRWSDGSAAQPYAGWVDAALMPTPDATLQLVTGVNADAACATPPGARVYGCSDGETVIYLTSAVLAIPMRRPAWWPENVTHTNAREVLLHELGHVFDDRHMTDASRAAFQTIDHASGGWRESGSLEHFAEAYRLCATWGPSRYPLAEMRRATNGVVVGVHGTFYGYHPTRNEYWRACRLIESVEVTP